MSQQKNREDVTTMLVCELIDIGKVIIPQGLYKLVKARLDSQGINYQVKSQGFYQFYKDDIISLGKVYFITLTGKGSNNQ